MQRILPTTQLEKKILCLGAVFIEEGQVLDELFQVIGADLEDTQDLSPDIKEQVLNEICEYFFRLDMNFDPEMRAECIEILEDFWGVRDRNSLLKTLENILQQGHRTKFNILRTCISPEGDPDKASFEKFKKVFTFDLEDAQQIQMKDEDYLKLAKWFQRTHRYLGDAGILAWDAARFVHLVRLSFVTGYLSDEEAWAQLVKAGPLVEGAFDNWMGFSQSFLIGRTFWSGTDDLEVKSCCERLLGHPASPWQFFSWT